MGASTEVLNGMQHLYVTPDRVVVACTGAAEYLLHDPIGQHGEALRTLQKIATSREATDGSAGPFVFTDQLADAALAGLEAMDSGEFPHPMREEAHKVLAELSLAAA